MLKLENDERIVRRRLKVCRRIADTIVESASGTEAARAAVDRIAAVRNGPRRILRREDHRNDYSGRREVDNVLDFGVVAARHAVEARDIRPSHGHKVVHCRLALEFAMLAVEPHEVEACRAGKLRHGRIRECYGSAKRHLARAHLFKEAFQSVDFHFTSPKDLAVSVISFIIP